MVATLTDAKRAAIAEKLADMRALQNLFITNEEMFVKECRNDDICKRFEDMLADDRKNLGIIETVITQYGIQGKPKETVVKMLQEVQHLMKGSELTLFEKISQHELLKHKQVMTGLLVHKAAQLVGADVEAAIAPLNTVNFESRAHQEQLKGILEYYGTIELTGSEPDQSLWGRVQDAVAALTGVFGSAVTQASDRADMTIEEIIRMDHTKATTLFMQIEQSNDAQKIQEYFGQLYKDLSVHAEAEEQVVYPAVRSFFNKTQDLYNEQAQQKQLLNELKAMSPSATQFKDRVRQLKDLTMHHVREEENEMFPAIRSNCSSQQQQQMATQFKEAKKQLQIKMTA